MLVLSTMHRFLINKQGDNIDWIPPPTIAMMGRITCYTAATFNGADMNRRARLRPDAAKLWFDTTRH